MQTETTNIVIYLNTDFRLQLDVLRFQNNAMGHLFLYVLDEGNTLKKITTYSKDIYIYTRIYMYESWLRICILFT